MKGKIALVLSGGGARGIAHIGAIEVLQEQGYEIGSIAGTSMGALVGGVFALGKLEAFKNWICTLDKLKTFTLVDFTLSKQGLVKGDRVLGKMKDFIPDTQIEDLPIPYTATAADIINKKEVVFKNGSIYNAIRASISIPTVFTPVKTEKGLLVDGGVINNIPISNVSRSDGDKLFVVNVNANIPVAKREVSKKEKEKHELAYQKKLKEFYGHLQKILPISGSSQKNEEERLGYFNLISHTIGFMTYQMAQLHLQSHQYDCLINVSRDSCGTYDFYKAEEMIAFGRQATEESLKKYQSEN